MFSEYIPATFLALALAHFVALISPGADFFLIVGHSIRNGFKGSRFICIGIALGNGLYIAFAIMGLALIKNHPLIFISIESLGAAYLLWMGILLIKSQPRSGSLDFELSQNKLLSMPKQLGMGILSALLNPKNLIFYMSLMTSILGSSATFKQQIFSGVWMFSAVLLWDLAIAFAISHFKSTTKFSHKLYLVERISGIILILIALAVIVHLLTTFYSFTR